MIKTHFEGHKGFLNLDTNGVKFYEHIFPNITGAMKFLKDVKVPDAADQYTAWNYRGTKGLQNKLDGWILINGRWLDEEFAKDLIKIGGACLKIN